MRKPVVLIITILSIFAALAVSSMIRKSATCDELAHHLPSGYVFLTKGDLRFDTSAPPLPRYIASLPMLFMDIHLPNDKAFWRREDRGEFGRDFFRINDDKYRNILLFGRIMVLIVSVFGGLILYLWAKRVYSDRAGIFALFLYCLSPNIIAHAGLATTDAIAAVFIFLAAFMFWRFLELPGYANAVIAGAALGLALLSKYTALLMLPVFLVFPYVKMLKSVKKNMFFSPLLVLLVAFLTVWAGYGFETKPILVDTLRAQEKLLMVKGFCSKFFPFCDETLLNSILYKIPLPLSSYILGVLGVIRHGVTGHGFFFMGNWYTHGLPYYYIVAFLVKTPLPMTIAFVSGLLLMTKRRPRMVEYYILSFIAVFFIAASFSRLQLGLRYILPIYPFCFMIAGGFFDSAFTKRLLHKIFAGILILWYAASCMLIWPDYLSYFNELIGGPANGYKYLRDSNIDWGQDLPALKDYVNKNGVDHITVSYFGEDDPGRYGITFDRIKSEELEIPKDKVYAISVQCLDSVKWTKSYRPTSRAGYSMFIYDLRKI